MTVLDQNGGVRVQEMAPRMCQVLDVEERELFCFYCVV